jgi:hypothetical protein
VRITRDGKEQMINQSTKVILATLAAVFLTPALLGYVCSRICAGYWATGGLLREGSVLIPDIITRMHFSALFEIMLICVIVSIGGVAAGLVLAKKPMSTVKTGSKSAGVDQK